MRCLNCWCGDGCVSTAKPPAKDSISQLVRAEHQAACAEKILPMLTEEELAVFRRGRNAQVHSIPSHASRAQYSTATALEALFGWLYLGGHRQRASDLFDVMMEE